MIKVLKKIIRVIFCFDTLSVYKFRGDIPSVSITSNERHQLSDDSLCLYENEDLVHHSHYAFNGGYISEINKSIYISDSLYIYNCVTKEAFRGKGYYKSALSFLIKRFCSSHDIYICALRSNLASIYMIEKLGFEIVGSVTFMRFLCIKLTLNIEIRDEKISFL